MSTLPERVLETARTLEPARAERMRTTHSPEVAEAIGTALATRLPAHDVNAVVVWADGDGLTLGHVVARELGADLVLAHTDGGRLLLGEPEVTNLSCVLLDWNWEGRPGLDALVRLVRAHGGVPTAVASVLASPRVRESGLPGVTPGAEAGDAGEES